MMKKRKYRGVVRGLALLLLLALLAGCAAGESSGTTSSTGDSSRAAEEATREFTDSLGRTLAVPEEITKIAVTGPLAQIVVFAIAPDEMVALASAWPEDAEGLIDEKYTNLPELGQLYGGKGDLNKEEVLKSGAQVIIDVGEVKEDMTQELDELSAQVGIPFVHITAALDSMGTSYRLLGELLGKEEAGETLAAYCEATYEKVAAVATAVGENKTRALYCLGDFGQNVIARGSYHAEVMDLLTENVAEIQNPTSKGTGTEVDMEQIMLWDPDVVLFAPNSIYDMAQEDEQWENVRAIREGNYYQVPQGPYNWMGSPPSVQRYLGMLWLAKTLYPETAAYDLYEECAAYFSLFYHTELTEETFHTLVGEG